jgi:hypothetical protein
MAVGGPEPEHGIVVSALGHRHRADLFQRHLRIGVGGAMRGVLGARVIAPRRIDDDHPKPSLRQRRWLRGDLGGAAAHHQIAMGAADLAGAADCVEQSAVLVRFARRGVRDLRRHVRDPCGLSQAHTADHRSAAGGLLAALGVEPFGDVGNFPTSFCILPQCANRLVIDAKIGGNLAVALLGRTLEPALDEQSHLLACQMPAVQIEVFGELLLVGIAEANTDFDRHIANAKACGDPQPVGAVDDIARLVDDDRDDDGLAFGDVGAQRSKLGLAQRRQQIGEWQLELGVANNDGRRLRGNTSGPLI